MSDNSIIESGPGSKQKAAVASDFVKVCEGIGSEDVLKTYNAYREGLIGEAAVVEQIDEFEQYLLLRIAVLRSAWFSDTGHIDAAYAVMREMLVWKTNRDRKRTFDVGRMTLL